MPAAIGCVFGAQPVRLHLVIATEFQKEQTKAAAGRIAQSGQAVRVAPHRRHEDLPEHEPQLGTGGPRVRLDSVAGGDVSDLMTQYACQLRLVT